MHVPLKGLHLPLKGILLPPARAGDRKEVTSRNSDSANGSRLFLLDPNLIEWYNLKLKYYLQFTYACHRCYATATQWTSVVRFSLGTVTDIAGFDGLYRRRGQGDSPGLFYFAHFFAHFGRKRRCWCEKA